MRVNYFLYYIWLIWVNYRISIYYYIVHKRLQVEETSARHIILSIQFLYNIYVLHMKHVIFFRRILSTNLWHYLNTIYTTQWSHEFFFCVIFIYIYSLTKIYMLLYLWYVYIHLTKNTNYMCFPDVFVELKSYIQKKRHIITCF